MQLLANRLMEQRIDQLHSVMSIPFMGILPPGYPPGGMHVHCTAAMGFAACLLGWMLPTALLLRSHCRRAHARSSSGSSHRRRRSGSGSSSSAQNTAVGGEGLWASAPKPAGAIDRLTRICEEWVLADDAPGLRVCVCACLVEFAWLGCTLFAMAA